MKGKCTTPLTIPSGPSDFETIYRDYHKSVYSYIYGQLLHREAAEDLTADVFVAHPGKYPCLPRVFFGSHVRPPLL